MKLVRHALVKHFLHGINGPNVNLSLGYQRKVRILCIASQTLDELSTNWNVVCNWENIHSFACCEVEICNSIVAAII